MSCSDTGTVHDYVIVSGQLTQNMQQLQCSRLLVHTAENSYVVVNRMYSFNWLITRMGIKTFVVARS